MCYIIFCRIKGFTEPIASLYLKRWVSYSKMLTFSIVRSIPQSTIGSITRTGYTTDISLFESPLEESESELLLNRLGYLVYQGPRLMLIIIILRSFHEGVVTPKLPGLEYMSPPVFIPKPLTYSSPTNHFVSMPLNEPNRDPSRKPFPCANWKRL